jgi:hypothetical protein
MGIKKVVCLNKGLGPTVLGRGDSSADVGELCRRVAAASGVSGLTGFDFVRHPEKGPLLIDSHLARMSPIQHFDFLYGVDFGAALGDYLAGKNTGKLSIPVSGPAFIKFPEVLQLTIQGDLGELLKKNIFPVKTLFCPVGDPLTGIRVAAAIVVSQFRVNIGQWRRRFLRATTRKQ